MVLQVNPKPKQEPAPMPSPRACVFYRGHVIWRNAPGSNRLRWTALGGFAADTLAGIKALIRDSQT